MKIAVLGWGSLIWDPRTLAIEGDWEDDGPRLPLEFARVSKSRLRALTLVIVEGGKPAPVLWAVSTEGNLPRARKNLKEVEDTPYLSNIGYMTASDQHSRHDTQPIRDWLKETDFEAVIWADFISNFEDRTKQPFTPETAIAHLEGLTKPGKVKAEEYVRRAPEQIQTPLRTKLVEHFGWTYQADWSGTTS